MSGEEIKGHKEQYNKALLRQWKGFVYLEDKKIPLDKRLKWVSEYQTIVNEVEHILSLFNAEGIKYTPDEVTGGFYV